MTIAYPWNDRAGRFSTLRVLAWAIILIPAILLAIDALTTGGLGSKPVTEATHRVGEWTIRLLVLTLAITPLRHITGWGRWISIRRLLGVSVFFYALAHMALYVVDENFNVIKAASEIVLRPYLTIGFIAVLGLGALAATSTDAMIRKLKRNWSRLHKAIYLIVTLGIVHYFMQSKLDATDAALMMGLTVLTLCWRGAMKLGFSLRSPLTLVGVAIVAGGLTAGLEASWYAIATNIKWDSVLAANLDIDIGYQIYPRPAVYVALVGLLFALVPPAKSLIGTLKNRQAKAA